MFGQIDQKRRSAPIIRPICVAAGAGFRLWARKLFGLAWLSVLFLPGCVAPNSPDACRIVPVAEIPLRMVGNLPVINVSINGRPARFVVDTGANIALLSEAAVNRLGLRYDLRLSGYTAGIGAKAPTRYTDGVRITVGGHELKPLNIPVISKISVLDATRGVDGLLGLDAIADFDIDLDIPNRRIGLNKARNCPDGQPPFAGPVDTFKLPPSPYHFAYVPVVIDGRGLNLIADTGASTTYINQAQLGLSEADVTADRTILGRSSGPDSLDVHVHRFHSAQIGSVSFEDVNFAVGPLPLGDGGLLGNDFWRRRRAWISFVGGAMTVQQLPNKSGTRLPD